MFGKDNEHDEYRGIIRYTWQLCRFAEMPGLCDKYWNRYFYFSGGLPRRTGVSAKNDGDYRCFFIKGNKEDYWINYEKEPKGWKEFDSTTGSLYYTYQNLEEKDLQFFKSLPLQEALALEGLMPVTISHGSPRKANEKLLPDRENTFLIMENNASDYILCGHTHI